MLRGRCRCGVVDVDGRNKEDLRLIPFCLRATRCHNNGPDITHAGSADTLALGVSGGAPPP